MILLPLPQLMVCIAMMKNLVEVPENLIEVGLYERVSAPMPKWQLVLTILAMLLGTLAAGYLYYKIKEESWEEIKPVNQEKERKAEE